MALIPRFPWEVVTSSNEESHPTLGETTFKVMEPEDQLVRQLLHHPTVEENERYSIELANGIMAPGSRPNRRAD